MLDLQGAVYTRLIGQTALTALLATYAGQPAIFSSAMPSDHDLGPKASLIIDAPFANRSDDTITEEYRDAEIRIRCFAAPDGSNLALLQAAEATRAALKQWPRETISGAEFQVSSVTGPDAAPTTDPSVDGLLVSVRILIKES